MNISLNQIITPEGAFLIGLICIIYLYIRILRRKSAKTRIELSTSPDEIPQSSMTETELDRYSRHILLREIGGQGQSKLRKAKVLVVGAGGLGSPILSYLAAAGELKTKPTQHSVKTLMQSGINPDVLVCRTEHEISEDIKRKLALFCNVKQEDVIQSIDADTIYDVPNLMFEEGLSLIHI